ncbi:MAG: transcriptional repressor [Elusimicrobiota bacterium]
MPGHGWRHRLRGCGYRMTMPREVILDILSQTKEHLSAKEIYLRAHKKYPSCGMTTAYRTLEILAQMGLVIKFDFGDGQARYELAEEHSRKKHHHHLVCRKCKTVIDYAEFIEDELELLDKTMKGLSRKYRFTIEAHEIVFKGLCERCGTVAQKR